jgi:hypothetical protein
MSKFQNFGEWNYGNLDTVCDSVEDVFGEGCWPYCPQSGPAFTMACDLGCDDVAETRLGDCGEE